MLAAIPRVITGDGVQMKRVGDRFIIENSPDFVEAGPQIQNFVVMSEQADYLTCVVFDFPRTEEVYDPDLGVSLQALGLTGTTVYVAKPYWLQQSPFNGKIVTLNGTPTTLTYTGIGTKTNSPGGSQSVTPSYFAGDVIGAYSGSTGLWVGEVPINWTDLNTAGRIWVGTGGSGITSINTDTTAAQNIGLSFHNFKTDFNLATAAPAWSATQNYNVGWIVSKTGVNYYCILAHLNQTPPNATYWRVVTGALTIIDIPNAVLAARGVINIDTTSVQPMGNGPKRFTYPLLLGDTPGEGAGYAAELHLNGWNGADQRDNFGTIFFGDETSGGYGYIYGQGDDSGGGGTIELGVASDGGYGPQLSTGILNNGNWDPFSTSWVLHASFTLKAESTAGGDDPAPFFAVQVGATVYPGLWNTQSGFIFKGGLFTGFSCTDGDILIGLTAGTTRFQPLAIGTTGKLLTVDAGLPAWRDWDANAAPYNASVGASWSGTPPATIRAALDRLAAVVKALNLGVGP